MSGRTVRFAPNAWADLKAIETYLRREAGAAAAAQFSTRVFDRLDPLLVFPKAGRSVVETNPSIRFAIRPWIIFYEELDSQDVLLVRRIVDGRRNLDRLQEL